MSFAIVPSLSGLANQHHYQKFQTTLGGVTVFEMSSQLAVCFMFEIMLTVATVMFI